MKKINWLLIMCVLTFNASKAQEKTTVGILPFTYVPEASSRSTVNSIQEAVANSFVKTKRFAIVDRTKMDQLADEKKLQRTEDFIDGNVIKQGVSLGAQYLVSGHVISAQATAATSASEDVVTYQAKLAISLKVIDVSTGQVVHSESIQPKSGSMFGGLMGMNPTTPEAAISKAISSIEDKIDDFVKDNFPVSFAVVEIQEKDKSGEASSILISGGSSFGLKKGDRLKVVEVLTVEVNGKKLQRKKEIGEIKITKVEDENFSICSVLSGGADINSKFEAKAKLNVVTKD